MKKIAGGCLLLVSLSSCDIATDAVNTMKNNIKESVSLPSIVPNFGKEKSKKEKGQNPRNEATDNFTFSNFLTDKLGL